ncbi:hypothetical protein HYH03_008432 [Edaphochlamys debaryana]|uniref:Prolyl 4-hydroxylase alpha subunit domain-containing protein n=1 Tax=Edaphochlamys debaryana TaxID=47281 RepID=A0A835Y378_9CHLO|nr:hypothetical protein HYH03_008432 [Edaphochlamys debaryana]|eukprot:KAG2493296.1 hypothetical protein HYH03_008432 [Edaphochlamys debaryana]
MGKTLKKQRKQAAKAAEEEAAKSGGVSGGNNVLAVIAKRLKYKLPANPKKKIKLTPLITEALNAHAWDDAATLLGVLEKAQDAGGEGVEIPKLGAVMRWVRAADLAGTEAIAAKLLAGVMRVAAGPQPHPAAAVPAVPAARAEGEGGEEHEDGAAKAAIPVRRFPPWVGPPAAEGINPPPQGGDAEGGEGAGAKALGPYKGRFGVVPLPPEYAGTNTNASTAPNPVAGAAAGTTALPHIAKDLKMYCTEPGTIQWADNASRPPVQRVEVPHVPGAFCLVGALSRHECAQIIACAEEMGYTVDPDYVMSASARAGAAGAGVSAHNASAARNGGSGGGERGAAGCVWLADESLQGPLYERVAHLLPQRLCGGDLAGLNCRWRLYRYDKGSVYRPHVDGAWPGSGIKDGKYEFDAFGDRWSRLTFLVYLNDGFEGGCTTYYTPAQPGSGACLEAHSVKPVCGNIMVFPHGDTMGSLVHEGAAVTSGSKYVIRTEVLYKLAPGVTAGGAGAPQAAMPVPVPFKRRDGAAKA